MHPVRIYTYAKNEQYTIHGCTLHIRAPRKTTSYARLREPSRIWVCKSQRCFYDAPVTGSGFENREGDTVKISMSRHTCRKMGASSLPLSTIEAREHLTASLFQSLIHYLTCQQFFLRRLYRSANGGFVTNTIQGSKYPLFEDFVQWLLCQWRAENDLDMHCKQHLIEFTQDTWCELLHTLPSAIQRDS